MDRFSIKVQGRSFDGWLDPDTHTFRANLKNPDDGFTETLEADSFELLKAKLTKAIKAAGLELAIPFITEKGRRGTIRGLHSRRYNTALITWDDGTKDQYEYARYGGDGPAFKPDAPVEEIQRFRAQIEQLTNERDALINEWMLNISAAVREASGEASG